MIHREVLGRKLSAAMITNTRGSFALPPLTRAQIARFLPLAANLFVRDFD
jgi:hypothetical protein